MWKIEQYEVDQQISLRDKSQQGFYTNVLFPCDTYAANSRQKEIERKNRSKNHSGGMNNLAMFLRV